MGLITPIVPKADILSVVDIAFKMRELVDKVNSNKIKPSEYQGGSFTISNLGMFGVHNFRAIINPPQRGILAVGSGDDVIVRNGEGNNWK